MNYKQLNRYDIIPEDDRYSDAWRRVLNRLGDYTEIIVRAFNIRPAAVTLIDQTPAHVLVRISTPEEHLLLRIAPEDDLAGEVYFGRSLTAHHLPAARVIRYDLACNLVPFTYILESHIGGIRASQVEQPYLLRAVARQVGRTLRRMHRVSANGWGRPVRSGRWPTPDWHAVLAQLHARFAPEPADMLVFDETERETLAALLAHPLLACDTPRLMHGAIGPLTARCTIGDHVQLEALLEPGPVIGGDGLLDVAFGTDPAYPEAWRTGLLEGYAGTAPLTPAEQERLWLLQAISWYWSACWRYMRAEPFEDARNQARMRLQEWHQEYREER